MDHLTSNFENINYKTELEVKVSLLEKENFELKGQLIDKLLIIKQLKTSQKTPSPRSCVRTSWMPPKRTGLYYPSCRNQQRNKFDDS